MWPVGVVVVADDNTLCSAAVCTPTQHVRPLIIWFRQSTCVCAHIPNNILLYGPNLTPSARRRYQSNVIYAG